MGSPVSTGPFDSPRISWSLHECPQAGQLRPASGATAYPSWTMVPGTLLVQRQSRWRQRTSMGVKLMSERSSFISELPGGVENHFGLEGLAGSAALLLRLLGSQCYPRVRFRSANDTRITEITKRCFSKVRPPFAGYRDSNGHSSMRRLAPRPRSERIRRPWSARMMRPEATPAQPMWLGRPAW
jgi:hypothetical protein